MDMYHKHTHVHMHVHIQKQIHVHLRVRVRVCFFLLCGVMSCAARRWVVVVGCRVVIPSS